MNFYEFLRVYPDNEEVEGGGDPLEAKESEDDCADENDANHLPDESVALDETIVVKRPSAPVFKMPGTNTAAGRKRPATRASSKVLETPVGKVNVPMLIKPKLNSTVRKTRPREISYSSRGSILEPPPSFLLLDKLHKLGDKASKLELSPGTQAAIPEMRQLQEKLQNVLNQLDKK
uniref:Uncharacterized protein n=1 Tax=Plectus sambesii TaxID=2011161 RepID=A0A914XKE4_9BILA